MTDAPVLSLPKDKIRVLLLEGVNDSAVARFTQAGYSNLERLPKALDGTGADRRHQGRAYSRHPLAHADSRAQVLEAADRLIAVGCFSVGINQVDLDAAERLGVPVFNAPFSNTRSVAELVIGEIVMLLRRIFPRSVSAPTAAGTNRPTTATRCAARRSASSATATSARSFPISPRPWACG